MLKIIYSDESEENLTEIINFISIWSPKNALIVIWNIINTISNLSIFPELWKVDFWRIRILVDSKYWYRISYEIYENFILILSIYKNKR